MDGAFRSGLGDGGELPGGLGDRDMKGTRCTCGGAGAAGGGGLGGRAMGMEGEQDGGGGALEGAGRGGFDLHRWQTGDVCAAAG